VRSSSTAWRFFWCAFLFLRGVAYYQQFREKETAAARLQVQLVQARMTALRMQLNPHFLFNAMNSISSLMRTDVNAADQMLEQLSSLLRMTLERGEVQLVPLRKRDGVHRNLYGDAAAALRGKSTAASSG